MARGEHTSENVSGNARLEENGRRLKQMLNIEEGAPNGRLCANRPQKMITVDDRDVFEMIGKHPHRPQTCDTAANDNRVMTRAPL